ncbi:hypothetical protein [Gordonia otitidis]|uniref:AbiEi antitoxin C-terminal domain-containing protein n=1 Tax=Gordonia otitidis (strain DSM 44809 / CCUG 52243 / JCM 12355 / NBRC 100426 / IFM 10032) TaxID=1108044 RepID=H5TQ41_GORO1|nr:hypothetical protein [Gordonia otitidis]GAB35599.1 hypothetical protein GOOTI_170_00660 [Gordonia otitidis NBRC 100426]
MTSFHASDPDGSASDSRIIYRRTVIGEGHTDRDIRRALRDQQIERLRQGSYVSSSAYADLEDYERAETRYRDMVVAAARSGGPRRFLSHQSAAVMLGVPLLNPDRSTVHFVSERSGRTSPGLAIHQAPIPDEHVVSIDGILVTSIGRTVCDVARLGNLRQAVCALDSGLYQGRIREQPIDLAAIVDALGPCHGINVLRTALLLATDLSESIGETISRCIFCESELIPDPELQVVITLPDGTMYRCDFGWRDSEGNLRVVGEFDGRLKYHRASADSGAMLPEEVIYDEKLREDAIRARDITFARWTWNELAAPRRLTERIHDALLRGGVLK